MPRGEQAGYAFSNLPKGYAELLHLLHVMNTLNSYIAQLQTNLTAMVEAAICDRCHAETASHPEIDAITQTIKASKILAAWGLGDTSLEDLVREANIVGFESAEMTDPYDHEGLAELAELRTALDLVELNLGGAAA